MKAEIKDRFETASQYHAMMARVFFAYEQLPLVVLSHLRTHLRTGAHVLDVGCGTGSTLAAFAAHQPDRSFVGVDPAEAMAAASRARITSANVADRVSVVVGTVDDLPDEAAFDAATAILVAHLLPDDGTKLRLLQGVFRRLVPRGWILLASLYGDLGTASAQVALRVWLEYIALQESPQEVQDVVRRRATVEDSLVSEARIVTLLGEAGMRMWNGSIRFTSSVHGWHANDSPALGFMRRSGMYGSGRLTTATSGALGGLP